MDEGVRQEIEKIIRTHCQDQGAEVFDLAIRSQRNDVRIIAVVDKPCGGITLEECARLNRSVATEIDSRQLLAQGYVLELDSPGLDWTLCNQRDFLRARGRQVHFQLKEPMNNTWEFDAQVSEAKAHEVVIVWEGQHVPIPFEKIQKAREVV